MADQTDTYTVKIVADAQSALEQLEQLRKNIDSFKARITEMAQASGEDFNKVAEGIRRATEEARRAAEKQLETTLKGKTEMPAEDFAKALAAAQAPVDKLNNDYKALGFAVQELNKEQNIAADSAKKFGGDATAATTQFRTAVEQTKQKIVDLSQQLKVTKEAAATGLVVSGQAETKVATQALRELNLEQKKIAEEAKRFGGDSAAAMKAYRDQVNQLKSDIQQLAKQQGTSIQEAAKGLQLSGKAPTALVSQALKELNQEQKQAAELAKKYWGDSAAAANAYRVQIDQIKKDIVNLSKQQGISLQDAAKGLQASGKAPTDQIRQALRELNQEQKIAAEQAKKYYGDASVAADEYRKRIDQLKNTMMQLAQQQNLTLQQAAKGMQLAGVAPSAFIGQAQKELSQEANAAVAFMNAMKGINSAATNTTTSVVSLIDRFSQLGQIGKFVFGTVLGVGAIQALRGLIDLFKEAIQAGLKFQHTLFTFEVAVRGLQRAGMDTTLEEWRDLIEGVKKQFPIFPREQITEAVSLAALMTREFGFTADQISEVVKMSATLAELTGKDLHEAVRGITYAIGSGYFETLQRVGINISRQIVAEEALRQGYEGSYTALDQNVRAMITYNIIQRNLAAIQPDASKKLETTAGQVLALTAAWQDLLATIGLIITENKAVFETVRDVAKAIAMLRDALDALDKTVGTSVTLKLLTNPPTGFSALIYQLINGFIRWRLETIAGSAQWKEFVSDVTTGIGIMIDKWKEWLRLIPGGAALLKQLEEATKPKDILGDLPTPEMPRKSRDAMEADMEEWKNNIEDITKEMNEAIQEEEEAAAQKRRDLWQDYFDDLKQLYIDFQRSMADLEVGLQRDLADIETGRLQDIEDENRDYANQAAEAAAESAGRRADAERKYRDQELIAELRFQERLRQLREGFLFELEDAVRERDARQIIRLTRQYNMEREQLIREEEINKKERWLAYQRQLQDIDRQKQERMNRLYQEHIERLQEIDIQAERERQRAQLEYDRKKQDEELKYQQDKTDREIKLRDQLEQLKADTQARIDEIVTGLLKEKEATHNQVDAIAREYEAVYGPGGRIDRAIRYYLSLLGALSGGYPGARPPTIPNPGEITPGNAEGGTKIVTKPTYELFGEAGPEMVTFTPLGRAGVNVGKTQGSVPAGMARAGGGNGRLLVEVRLDDGLEYRIVDQAMNELADVMTKVERARK